MPKRGVHHRRGGKLRALQRLDTELLSLTVATALASLVLAANFFVLDADPFRAVIRAGLTFLVVYASCFLAASFFLHHVYRHLADVERRRIAERRAALKEYDEARRGMRGGASGEQTNEPGQAEAGPAMMGDTE